MLDDESKIIFPSNVMGVPNFNVRPPLFCATPNFYKYISNLKTFNSSSSYREIEASEYNVVVRDTGDMMINSDGNSVKVGLGVFATKDLKKGTRLPIWGSMGFEGEFNNMQLKQCDRKVEVRFKISDSLKMCIHPGCVGGYINDCTHPYEEKNENCLLRDYYPHFDSSQPEFYVSIILSKDVRINEQLFIRYGKGYWKWGTD